MTPISERIAVAVLAASGSSLRHYTIAENKRRIIAAAGVADELVEALGCALQLCQEALPKFNWGASALDANAIQLLNEVPGKIAAALAKAGEV